MWVAMITAVGFRCGYYVQSCAGGVESTQWVMNHVADHEMCVSGEYICKYIWKIGRAVLTHYKPIYSIIVIPGSSELISLWQTLLLPWVLNEYFHRFCVLQWRITKNEGIVNTLALTCMHDLPTSLESFHMLARKSQP